MISDLSAAIFVGALVAILVFIVWNIRTPRKLQLINKLYLAIAVLYAVWVLALLFIRFTRRNKGACFLSWDAITNSVGTFCSSLFVYRPLLCQGWRTAGRGGTGISSSFRSSATL